MDERGHSFEIENVVEETLETNNVLGLRTRAET